MRVASRHDSGTTELVAPTAEAAEPNCPSGRSSRSSRPEQVSSRVLPPALSIFEKHTCSVHSSVAALVIPAADGRPPCVGAAKLLSHNAVAQPGCACATGQAQFRLYPAACSQCERKDQGQQPLAPATRPRPQGNISRERESQEYESWCGAAIARQPIRGPVSRQCGH